jgi:hypothetical protein
VRYNRLFAERKLEERRYLFDTRHNSILQLLASKYQIDCEVITHSPLSSEEVSKLGDGWSQIHTAFLMILFGLKLLLMNLAMASLPKLLSRI